MIKSKTQTQENSAPIKEVEKTQASPLTAAYNAVRKILESIKEDENNPNSLPYFKTIKLDNGQLNRIKNNKHNLEYPVVFPAVFIHFINVYYNVGQSNVAEGKGIMRIHYILNRLNNSDDVVEAEGFELFTRINAAIQDNKNKYSALSKRFQLAYWDQPLTFDDGLQPFWIDYEIWFNDFTAYKERNYVERYVVFPPFTNHSDQDEEHRNGHEDHKEWTYEDASGFQTPNNE